MRAPANADGAYVAAAGPLAIDKAIEFDPDAEQGWVAEEVIHWRAPPPPRGLRGRPAASHIFKNAEGPFLGRYFFSCPGAGGKMGARFSCALLLPGVADGLVRRPRGLR